MTLNVAHCTSVKLGRTGINMHAHAEIHFYIGWLYQLQDLLPWPFLSCFVLVSLLFMLHFIYIMSYFTVWMKLSVMVMGNNIHIHISAVAVSGTDTTPTGDIWKCSWMELLKYLYNSLMATLHKFISDGYVFPCTKLFKILGAEAISAWCYFSEYLVYIMSETVFCSFSPKYKILMPK